MKKLERSRSDRILFGVCGGMGEHFGVDANIIRIVWIVSLLAGGAGLIPYLAAIFLLPESDTATESSSESGPSLLGFGLIALAGVLFVRAFGIDLFGTRIFAFWTLGVLLPLALLVAGVFLVWPRTRAAVGFSDRRKPRRSVSNRVLAGVAGGIANELEVDANLVRLAFVLVGVVTSGFALVIYLLLVVILPEEELPGAVHASVSGAPGVPPVSGVPPTPGAPPVSDEPVAPAPPPVSPEPQEATVVDPAPVAPAATVVNPAPVPPDPEAAQAPPELAFPEEPAPSSGVFPDEEETPPENEDQDPKEEGR